MARKASKKMIGVYVEEETKNAVMKILDKKGITLTDFILACFYKLLDLSEREAYEEHKLQDGRTKEARARKANNANSQDAGKLKRKDRCR